MRARYLYAALVLAVVAARCDGVPTPDNSTVATTDPITSKISVAQMTSNSDIAKITPTIKNNESAKQNETITVLTNEESATSREDASDTNVDGAMTSSNPVPGTTGNDSEPPTKPKEQVVTVNEEEKDVTETKSNALHSDVNSLSKSDDQDKSQTPAAVDGAPEAVVTQGVTTKGKGPQSPTINTSSPTSKVTGAAVDDEVVVDNDEEDNVGTADDYDNPATNQDEEENKLENENDVGPDDVDDDDEEQNAKDANDDEGLNQPDPRDPLQGIKTRIDLLSEDEEEDSHFITYLVAAAALVAVMYIGYHNKRKIMSNCIGRKPSTGQRTKYQRLDQNVSEAMPSLKRSRDYNI